MRHALTRALVGAALVSTSALAQDDMGERHGLAAAIGVGMSSAGVSCAPQCMVDRQSGPAYMVRVGVHATPQLTFALEATLFGSDVKSLTPVGHWTLSFYTLTALWYPSSDDDFFIKVGAGISSTRADLAFKDVSSIELTASDLGVKVGVGKDYRLADKLAVTAFADALFSPRSQGMLAGSNSGAKISADLIQLGLAVTIP